MSLPKLYSPKLYIFYVGINDNGWITSPDRKLDDNLGGDGHVNWSSSKSTS